MPPSSEAHSPADPTRRTTLRGLSVLVWIVVFGLLATALTDRLGLKYVQGVIWPTDLHTFGLRASPRSLDVAILGSSRASFDLTPAAIDRCLSRKLDRPTTTANLARVFATAHTMRAVYTDLLHPDPPEVLVVAVAPEALDDTNPMMPASIAATAGPADVPRELIEARSLTEAVAALRPVVRGAETLPFFLAGRHRQEARLQWIMDHHGGGQWCDGTPACDDQNRDLEQVMAQRWAQAERIMLPTVRTERFGEYVAGEGRVHRALVELVTQAAEDGVQVLFVVLPLHERFQAEIPPSAQAAFDTALDRVAAAHSIPVWRPDAGTWASDPRAWVDPDHLHRQPSLDLSKRLCRDALVPILSASDTPPGTGSR